MIIKYGIDIESVCIEKNINKLINQTYKLLPDREEGIDWKRPLDTIIEEFVGMNDLIGKEELFFSLLCKLEGLYSLDSDKDFFIYRKTIFDCLGVMNTLKDNLCQD